MTTMRDPEWDQEGRDAALGLDLYESSLCPLCGQPRHICQDPALQFAWTATAPVRCHATTARLQMQAGFTEDTNPQSQALLFGVELAEGGG